jgi:hypothetical protein
MAQIPRGYDHLKCPMWRKPMSEVCHTCPWWIQIRGVDRNTGEPIADEWNCSMTIVPKLVIDTAYEARASGAATESFRNDLIKRIDPEGYAIEADAAPKRIGHG